MMEAMRRDPKRHPLDDEAVASARESAERRRRSTIAKVVVALAILIVFLLFVIWNSDQVTVDFVFFHAEVALVWVFLACAAIGALIAALLGRPRRRAMKQLIEELERQRRERE
jgi:uncharacterized integral membrane protein